MTLVLGIETSCDETAVGIVEDGKSILANAIFSQVDFHRQFGGVFPEYASRSHVDKLLPIITKALHQADKRLDDLDAIAVTTAPGLVGALSVGLMGAKALAQALMLPLIPVNHVEAHIYSSMMGGSQIKFPCLGVVLSGGHTSIVKVEAIGCYKMLSHTVDDAIGEAFDKVAKLFNLPYPGGPEIEKLALKGNPDAYQLTAGRVKSNPLLFSFSGIKTQVLYTKERLDKAKIWDDQAMCDLAASFQKVVANDLAKKIVKAAELADVKEIFLGGGVSLNTYLRKCLAGHASPTFQIHFPAKQLCGDNGAMIAGLAYHSIQKKVPIHSVDVSPQRGIF